MLPFHLVYHEAYNLDLGEHVFPAQKYGMIRARLLEQGVAGPDDFVKPEPATDDDVLLVHDPDWVKRLRTGTLSYADIVRLEIPYSKEMVEAFWHAAGGTILAARLALQERIGVNLGGGFHHGFRDHGEGFCAINDIAIGVRRMQQDKRITRAMIVDCDVHHGNGTAAIFAGDKTVFTISLHQFNNYPLDKPQSDIDVHLKDGVGDEEYLERLRGSLEQAMASSRPDLLVYVAGADPYEQDQLGGLDLTIEGLKQRDEFVIETALARQIPVVVVLAGGYAINVEDTVMIHCNTVRAAQQALEKIQ